MHLEGTSAPKPQPTMHARHGRTRRSPTRMSDRDPSMRGWDSSMRPRGASPLRIDKLGFVSPAKDTDSSPRLAPAADSDNQDPPNPQSKFDQLPARTVRSTLRGAGQPAGGSQTSTGSDNLGVASARTLRASGLPCSRPRAVRFPRAERSWCRVRANPASVRITLRVILRGVRNTMRVINPPAE
jgi:hypothetical protein